MRRRFGKDWEMIWRYKITARNKPVEKITGYRRLGKTRRRFGNTQPGIGKIKRD